MEFIDTLPVLPARILTGHKGTYGTLLGIGASRGMAGALALAGRAALLGGAGLVRLAVPDPVLETVSGFYPEPTMLPCPADDHGRFSNAAAVPLSEAAQTANVVFLGPGLGRSNDLDYLVAYLISNISGEQDKPMVLDADALNALAVMNAQNFLSKIPSERKKKTNLILTPHPGEFARLIGAATPTEESFSNRTDVAFEFARNSKVILVLKGHRTIVTDGKRIFVNTTGNPGMATGGSGDVLTGLIAALVGQTLESTTFDLFDAARLGVYLHGLAGDIAAKRFGQESVTATGILEYISPAFKLYRCNAD